MAYWMALCYTGSMRWAQSTWTFYVHTCTSTHTLVLEWSQFYRLAAIIFRSYELYSLTALFSWWTAAVAILTFLLLPRPLPLHVSMGPDFVSKCPTALHNLYQNENLSAERWRRKYYKTIKVFTRIAHTMHWAICICFDLSACDALGNKDELRDAIRCSDEMM